MRMCTGFWVGIGAGLMAGAAVGMMMPYGRDPMKTQVGKSIHKLGVAVDHAGQHRFRNALTRRAGSLGSPPFLIKSFLGLDFGKSSGIIITLSHLATPRIQKLEPEQLWRSRLVGRGRMIGNHVGP